MPANSVVKTFDVLENGRTRLLPCTKRVALHTLAFEGTEKALHSGIIITVAHPRHTHDDPQFPQAMQIAGAGIGTALIGMHEHLFGRTATSQSHLQRLAN